MESMNYISPAFVSHHSQNRATTSQQYIVLDQPASTSPHQSEVNPFPSGLYTYPQNAVQQHSAPSAPQPNFANYVGWQPEAPPPPQPRKEGKRVQFSAFQTEVHYEVEEEMEVDLVELGVGDEDDDTDRLPFQTPPESIQSILEEREQFKASEERLTRELGLAHAEINRLRTDQLELLQQNEKLRHRVDELERKNRKDWESNGPTSAPNKHLQLASQIPSSPPPAPSSTMLSPTTNDSSAMSVGSNSPPLYTATSPKFTTMMYPTNNSTNQSPRSQHNMNASTGDYSPPSIDSKLATLIDSVNNSDTPQSLLLQSPSEAQIHSHNKAAHTITGTHPTASPQPHLTHMNHNINSNNKGYKSPEFQTSPQGGNDPSSSIIGSPHGTFAFSADERAIGVESTNLRKTTQPQLHQSSTAATPASTLTTTPPLAPTFSGNTVRNPMSNTGPLLGHTAAAPPIGSTIPTFVLNAHNAQSTSTTATRMASSPAVNPSRLHNSPPLHHQPKHDVDPRPNAHPNHNSSRDHTPNKGRATRSNSVPSSTGQHRRSNSTPPANNSSTHTPKRSRTPQPNKHTSSSPPDIHHNALKHSPHHSRRLGSDGSSRGSSKQSDDGGDLQTTSSSGSINCGRKPSVKSSGQRKRPSSISGGTSQVRRGSASLVSASTKVRYLLRSSNPDIPLSITEKTVPSDTKLSQFIQDVAPKQLGEHVCACIRISRDTGAGQQYHRDITKDSKIVNTAREMEKGTYLELIFEKYENVTTKVSSFPVTCLLPRILKAKST